jgi:hypothetical protein
MTIGENRRSCVSHQPVGQTRVRIQRERRRMAGCLGRFSTLAHQCGLRPPRKRDSAECHDDRATPALHVLAVAHCRGHHVAGIYYPAQHDGSITAILVNLPADASSAITLFHEPAKAALKKIEWR